MQRRSTITFALAGIGLAAATTAALPPVRSHLASAATATETAANDPAPQVVMAATVRQISAAPAHRLAGTIHARVETDLGFRVGGT